MKKVFLVVAIAITSTGAILLANNNGKTNTANCPDRPGCICSKPSDKDCKNTADCVCDPTASKAENEANCPNRPGCICN